jgi:predicted Zn-dependent protease
MLITSLSMSVKAQETASPEVNTDKSNISKSDPVCARYGFSLQEEKEIGFQSTIILVERYGYFKNPKVNEYVNNIGTKVANLVSQRPEIKYNFFVLDTPEINAFAVPGGYIFITKGALKIISNEAELAGVLSHEIAHVELGHGLESISNSPNTRERIRIMKVNLEEGKGLTQQTLRSLLSKDKNLSSGIVNSGKLKDDCDLEFNEKGLPIIK